MLVLSSKAKSDNIQKIGKMISLKNFPFVLLSFFLSTFLCLAIGCGESGKSGELPYKEETHHQEPYVIEETRTECHHCDGTGIYTCGMCDGTGFRR